MATFVVTGFNRTRSKCYRPSYTSDLAPIYEDKIHHPSAETIQRQYVSNVFQSNSYHRQEDPDSPPQFKYDHDSVTSSAIRPVRQYRQKPQPSQTSVSMLNGIMANRFQSKRKSMDCKSDNPCDDKDNPCDDKNNPCDNRNGNRNIEKHSCISNNNNNYNNNNDNNTSDSNSCKNIPQLDRKTSLYQVPITGVGEVSRTGNGIISSLETAEDQKKENKWRKLQPEMSIPRKYLCPANGKLKRRCFVVCFVLLLAMIGTFVLVSVEGWSYKATGRGFTGDEPLIFGDIMRTVPNFTDIRDDGNMSDYNDYSDIYSDG